ncbi:hypothetical protein MM300_21000 [Evansella sp. LMS18]|jgi:hypothetical protein|uniref:hypothetical protein n=1 Tax=Evansella sp. LMS18 TaxID=2924033 RepID=UPI0020D0E93C|nr:hypothetical protein [Evansella sp. LMS18]UTR10324.1 hypothetical protein MM300_21000 [Evansella sp. LMS18]
MNKLVKGWGKLLLAFLISLILVGMVGGYFLAFLGPHGIIAGLLSGILVVLTYIAIQITPSQRGK